MAASALIHGGCSTDFIANQTAERQGNITVQFINNTSFRAAYTFGTYDSLDRNPPGPVTLQQLRLEPGTSTPVALLCRRNFAIGTQEMFDRIVDTDADEAANFDADAFDTTVHFSSAPADSDAAALPTEGTAAGRELLLGVDFQCDDRVLITFEQDPNAPGGFRIDFAVLPDTSDD